MSQYLNSRLYTLQGTGTKSRPRSEAGNNADVAEYALSASRVLDLYEKAEVLALKIKAASENGVANLQDLKSEFNSIRKAAISALNSHLQRYENRSLM